MTLIDLSIRRPVTVSMFTVAVLVFGLVVLSKMGVNLLPSIEYPTLTIRTDYATAAPAEVESLVTRPIEEAVGTVKNVRQIHSISRAGQSEIILSFHWGSDMDVAGLDVREKLDIVQLPLDIKKPRLLRYNPSLDPVFKISLYQSADTAQTGEGEQGALVKLRRFAEEKIKRQIETLEGVAAVKLNGGLEDEVQVLLDQSKLRQLNLTVADIGNRLKTENVNLSGGRVKQNGQQFLVRTLNEFQSVEQMGEAVIAQRDGKAIALKDIATVQQSYKERESITRYKGQEAVEVAIYKEGDANTVAVAAALHAKTDKMKKMLPEGWVLATTYDQSRFIKSAIDEVLQSAVLGGLLAMLVLFAFLRSLKSTLIISLAIPVSIIASFNMMFYFDVSLNIMSLGGIALAIGLLVDNAIVVLENIARYKEQGLSGKEAARKGAAEVASAVTASTLTTLAVFVPLIFVQGIAGQLFFDQALTVSFTLIASLLVALSLIPMLAAANSEAQPGSQETRAQEQRGLKHFFLITLLASLIKAGRWLMRAVVYSLLFVLKPVFWLLSSIFYLLQRHYPRMLHWSLNNRFLTLLCALVLFTASLMLIPGLGKQLMPEVHQGELIVKVVAPGGTSIDEMDAILATLDEQVLTLDGVDASYSNAGASNALSASTEQQKENQGTLNLVLSHTGEALERQVKQDLRALLASMPDLDYVIEQPSLFSLNTPLEIEVRDYDLDRLKEKTGRIYELLQQADRFTDVSSTLKEGRPEVRIIFDHDKINFLNLDTPQLAQQVADRVKGQVATRYTFRDRRIDVLVRLEEEQRNSLGDIASLIVANIDGKPVYLQSVAQVRIDEGPSEIHRLAQDRVAIVSTSLVYGGLDQATAEIRRLLSQDSLLVNTDLTIGGQSKELESSYQSLYLALGLAVFLVYIVMASQFESVKHPLVILFSVPLALTGSVLALYLTASSISVIVFIGLIMLAGIVVNNAIVLVDKINQTRSSGGVDFNAAILEACQSRLRPIIITTLTTILGMLPMALGLGDGAEIRAPMAITVIGGITLSTFLTLLVIPVVYSLSEGTRQGRRAQEATPSC